jgi:hypothetical protein
MYAKDSFETATTCHITRCWNLQIPVLYEWQFMESRCLKHAFRQFILCGQTDLSPVINSARVIVEELFFKFKVVYQHRPEGGNWFAIPKW